MTDSQISIDIDFGENVLGESPDPLTYMRITVDGRYVVGNEDGGFGSFMTRTLERHLRAIPDIVAGERAKIEYTNGPSWVVIEPVNDDDRVRLVGCVHQPGVENPKKRLEREVEKSEIISKHEWIRAIIEATESYLARLLKVNPDLATATSVKRLQIVLDDVKDDHGESIEY